MISWENAFCRVRYVEIDVLLDVEGDSLAFGGAYAIECESVPRIRTHGLLGFYFLDNIFHILDIDKSPAINILQ